MTRWSSIPIARPHVSIAEVYDIPAARSPLVPPSPPRRTMNLLRRIVAMRKNAIDTWGPRSYEEDVIETRFFGRNNFIVNAPEAIRHGLGDNYQNHARP